MLGSLQSAQMGSSVETSVVLAVACRVQNECANLLGGRRQKTEVEVLEPVYAVREICNYKQRRVIE